MEDNHTQKISSNEEIIDEVTRDLEKVLKDEASVKGEQNVEDFEKNEVYDFNKKGDNCDNQVDDEYFIDDVLLKNRDLNLSEEDKQKFKSEADKYKNEGNDLFRNGNYNKATLNYTEALRICPLEFTKDRAILYANRAAAKAKFMTNKDSAITDCTKASELDSNYTKVYLRRAQLYKETDKLDEALADYQKVLTLDPRHEESISAIRILQPMINERNEKLKAEMMDKLKDLGNMVLRPFGLSTNNFQMQKDESNGSYSVKFVQNPT